ncbi:MAG: hypothetical protein GPJ07_02580 [Microcystis aeruginosa G13-07]|jgi:hypothetical protein|nr:hypothetical protein [Microcystis aeruginosa SX13-01]NCS05552.1 hypothetical protein [Microcystis aeruginosa G13-07]NCT62472.1 hypothetical protein [Microcystis aeruginosa G13-01]
MLGTDASIVELHGFISRSINFFSLHHQDPMRFQKFKGDEQMPSLLLGWRIAIANIVHLKCRGEEGLL